MKETEFFYEQCVDEAQTIRTMKRQLLFLKQYTASLRLHSVLYGEECVQLQVEDELSDYLNYTRSIVQTSKNGGYVHRDPVLEAMERQRRAKERVMERLYSLAGYPAAGGAGEGAFAGCVCARFEAGAGIAPSGRHCGKHAESKASPFLSAPCSPAASAGFKGTLIVTNL